MGNHPTPTKTNKTKKKMTSFMSTNSTNVAGEFQAIILTQGDDNVLYPLCEEIPKSLIPIANRPLLLYQLRLLEKAGFEDIILVVSEQYEQIIGEYVARANVKVHLVRTL